MFCAMSEAKGIIIMNIVYQDIGLRIRNLREAKGYSRDQLSEMTEISSKFLYEIETGQKGLSAATLYRLSKKLSISADYLLCGHINFNDKHDFDRTVTLLNSKQLQLVIEFINLLLKVD